jgi:hypothetical protein
MSGELEVAPVLKNSRLVGWRPDNYRRRIRVVRLRSEVLGDTCVQVGIRLSQEQFDRDVQAFHLVQASGVARDLFEQFAGHLGERRGGTWLLAKVIVDDRTEEGCSACAWRIRMPRRLAQR